MEKSLKTLLELSKEFSVVIKDEVLLIDNFPFNKVETSVFNLYGECHEVEVSDNGQYYSYKGINIPKRFF